MSNGTVYQINIKGEGGKSLPKLEVPQAFLNVNGFEGDYNHKREKYHDGTLDRAVLLMPLEKIWEINEDGWDSRPGDFGGNIVTEGIPYDQFQTGQSYRIGTALIEITRQATPCGNLIHSSGSVTKENLQDFMEYMKDQRGLYAKVIIEGLVEKGNKMIQILK